MSKYTTQIRFILESYLQNKGIDPFILKVDQIIDQGQTAIFDFNYPIFDESYREPLQHNLLNYFYTREIGFETAGLFKQKLNSKMNMIIPKYNILYKSELYKLDPLSNNSEIEKFTRENSGNSTSSNRTSAESNQNQSSENTSQNIYSDTPQGMLSNKDYATNMNKDTSSNTSNYVQNGTSTSNDSQQIQNTENFIRNKAGLSGVTTSASVSDFISKFKSIDMMIAEELSDLFMNLW